MAAFAPANYPGLKEVALALPKVQGTIKFDMLMKYGDLNKVQAAGALKPENRPIIAIATFKDLNTPGKKATGWGYYPGNGHYVYINKIAADQYEIIVQAAKKRATSRNKSAWDALLSRAKQTMESIILHEIVHWGDNMDGLTKLSRARRAGYEDIGQVFMKHAYPKFIKFKRGGSRSPWIADLDIDGWLGWDKKGKPYTPSLSSKPPRI